MMRFKNISGATVLIVISSALLAACGSDNPESTPLAMGFVSVAVTDAPVDEALKVCVEFESVEFKHADEGVVNNLVLLESPIAIDLLAQQGTDSAPLLVGEAMQSGQYNWIRLGVNAPRGAATMVDEGEEGTPCQPGGSYIKLASGVVHNLYVPSADNSGLKLNRGFFLPPGGDASFSIDFDLRKSITAPPGQDPDYKMRPTLRIVDNAAVGSLQGSVAPELVAGDCDGDPAVYVFAGAGSSPDDYDGDDGDAVTSAKVNTTDGGLSYSYTVGFLAAPGSYVAAFTCNNDDPLLDQDTTAVSFEPAEGKPFDISANETTIVNFGE